MSFSDDLRKFAKKTNQSIDKTIRAATTSIFTAIVLRTPVDTGRARANWNYSTTSPDESVTDSTTYKPIKTKPGLKHILTNNLPYIEVLENGSSKKAPSGMVKVTVTEFEAHLKRAVK